MYDENSNNAASASAVNAAAVAAAAAAVNQSNMNGNVPVVPQTVNAPPPSGVPQVGGGGQNAASINQLFTAKDPRWLQLEVCREFQRGQCSRSNLECKYAHPPPHVDVQNGRVTACYDSIKGRCTRENPKCKYLHPPQHLKDQLLINGRQSLALKTLLCSQLSQAQQAQNHPALAPVNLAQLVHPQQQLVQAMPYQYYPGLATIYPTLMQAPPQADPYQQVQTNGGVPCKRPTLDKNGTQSQAAAVNAANLALYSQQQQFNPYLVPSLHGYVPAVSFSGQLPPPRY